VNYRVRLDERAQHRADVELTVDGAGPLELWMPVWTPGAYELRTWGRNVTLVGASDGHGQPLAVTRTSASTFHVAAGAAPISVRYQVYAAHASDDGSVLDGAHALINGSSLFLAVRGHEREPHQVRVVLPAGWRLATALDDGGGARTAASYEALIDAPIECGRFAEASVMVLGHELRIVVDGAAVPERLTHDLARVVEAEARIMGGLPFRRYLAIIHLTDAPGRVAALEHAASTSILMPSDTLADHEAYDELTYVVAHELFHVWNAKRLRPAELVPYDLTRAQPAKALWITEGVTEYFAHRTMLLSRRWSRAAWLEHESEEATRALDAAKLGGSLEQAAQLTWQPPDDNHGDWDAYYARGHLVALAIDAAIRAASDGKSSLDEVMRQLDGEATRAGGILPVDSDVLARACDRVAPGVGARVLGWARGGDEIEKLAPALAELGLGLEIAPPQPRTTAGFIAEPEDNALRVIAVAPDGPASLAGLHAGDRIITFDGAAPPIDYIVQLTRRKPYTPLFVDVTRGREHLKLRIELGSTTGLDCKLTLLPATPRILRLREAMLTAP
jgi:predicted metalloprotease with PDZ domain